MEILPIEIKWHICRFVKANPFGIIAPLSLTSRAWYDATAPILYETLIVRFGDSATLQKAVFELEEGRRGRLFLKHARRLDIVCLWNYSEKPRRHSNMIYQSMELVHYGLPASENTFLRSCLTECLDPELWPYIPDFRHYQEENWQPLISLIAHLEHLSELNFVVKNMYPPSLHQVLRQYHPECRLNIWTFQGVNLDTPILPRIQRPRAYENLDILCSSGLHTVAMDYFMDEAGRPWVHSDEILPIEFSFCDFAEIDCLNSQNDWAASFRDTLINAATDEDLARGIWDLIVSKQSTQSLRRLRLVPFGAAVYDEEERDAIWKVSRSFLVTCKTCMGQPPDVMEIGTEVWDFLGLPRGEIKGSEHWSSRLKKVMDNLWPLGGMGGGE
ncbi:hypothetical protein OAory_01094440 [Aspergillus oryzae]|uniref:F-box domain-containing protein n=1 Tax=Aspergillus oryzae TaxID=5062 RepID=A0A1S9DDS1_ASPOZ|nr:hypothetical protein OAory_01094440 [Aspergillus oryzae]